MQYTNVWINVFFRWCNIIFHITGFSGRKRSYCHLLLLSHLLYFSLASFLRFSFFTVFHFHGLSLLNRALDMFACSCACVRARLACLKCLACFLVHVLGVLMCSRTRVVTFLSNCFSFCFACS